MLFLLSGIAHADPKQYGFLEGINLESEIVKPPQVIFFDGEPLKPDLNPQRNPLFNECFYCEEDRKEWYYDFHEFKYMANLCGMDYVELRYDRLYAVDTLTIKTTLFFSVHMDKSIIDSVLIHTKSLGGEKSIRSTFAVSREILMDPFEVDSTIFSGAQEIAQGFDSFLESFHGDYKIHFLFANSAFTIDTNGIITDSRVSEHHLNSEKKSSPAYRLGTYLNKAQNRSAAERENTIPPQITELTCGSPLGLVDLNTTLSSPYGLSKLIIESGSFHREIDLKGKKEIGIRKNLNINDTCQYLRVTLVDIYGNRTERNKRIFTEQNEIKKVDSERRDTQLKVSKWSDGNPMRKFLYGFASLSQLGLIRRGLEKRAIKRYTEDSIRIQFQLGSIDQLQDTLVADHTDDSIPLL